MIHIIEFKQFELLTNIPLVDVRSPSEFQKGHIPNSINIPLFSDEERALVGTLYKQVSKDEAIKKGCEIVGPKMRNLIQMAQDLAVEGKIGVYCWRGGSRSESVAWLWNLAGLDVYKINGGHKFYRAWVKEQLNKKAKLVTLTGKTGAGKTNLLQNLKSKGFQIIDLEGLANHKGSAFGHTGKNKQPTNEQFENNLYQVWSKLDLNQMILVEDENQVIGQISIPREFFDQLKTAPAFYLNVTNERRVQNIFQDYKDIERPYLLNACQKIQKKLGMKRYLESIDWINQGHYIKAIEALLNYYDRCYDKSIPRYDRKLIQVDLPDVDFDQQSDILIKVLKSTVLF